MKKALSLKIIITTLVVISIGIYTISRLSNDAKNGSASILGADNNGQGDQKRDNAILVSTEIAATGDLKSLGSTSISWPGEIVSYGDAEIIPSRDGQIAELYVKIGDYVSTGEPIGRLNPPSVNLELTALLAEKKQALINAEAQEKATKKLVTESKKRIKQIETAIYRSRDTALDVAEKEAFQNSNSTTGANKELEALKISREADINSATAELAQAEAILPNKFNTARAAAKALSQRLAGALSTNGTAPDSPQEAIYFQIEWIYGALDSTSKGEYLNALSVYLTALNNEAAIPETDARAYIKASLKLMANTVAAERTTITTINTLRDIIFEDEQIFNEALNDYKDAQNDIKVKQTQLTKMTVGGDRDIISAESNVKINEAFLQTAESIKTNQIAEADEEFAKEKTALDVKIAELNRQLSLANAQVAAARAAYELVKTGTGEKIMATQSGIISAIYKKVGEYVTVDTKIAATSSKNTHDRFVRFRIPLDMQLPEKNNIVTIEKPGYPLNPVKAKISGVGLALDENGSYQADAEFMKPIDWPVNSSVRVIFSAVSNLALAPLTAIWWDDEETPKIWIVDDEGGIKSRPVELGRALGDRIEIEKGISEGDKFISIALPDLTEGLIVNEAIAGGTPENASKQPSEGHGHDDM